MSEAPRVYTRQVADAAGGARATVRRWANAGLQPLPTVYYGPRRGNCSWAHHALAQAQARRVASQIVAGRSFQPIRSALGARVFPPAVLS